MNVTTIGIDLAKNTFNLHGVDSHGKVVFQRFSFYFMEPLGRNGCLGGEEAVRFGCNKRVLT